METKRIHFEQYLSQLIDSCDNCLLLLMDPWSGHARLYESMVREVITELNPSPELFTLTTQGIVFNANNQKVNGSPLLYYLRDGQIRNIIEGIPTRYHLTNRLQLLNQSY